MDAVALFFSVTLPHVLISLIQCQNHSKTPLPLSFHHVSLFWQGPQPSAYSRLVPKQQKAATEKSYLCVCLTLILGLQISGEHLATVLLYNLLW